jgi:uncharacterized protein (TIRG00374 family)
MRIVLSWIRRLAYGLLPVVILWFILKRIDLVMLYETVREADPLPYLLGLACFPLLLVTAAIRWQLLIKQYLGHAERLGFLIRQYSIGLSMGVLIPGGVGNDIFRVAVIGRKYGRYASNVAILLEEKLISLMVCGGLVFGLSPWLGIDAPSSTLTSIVEIAGAILAGCLLVFVAIFLTGASAAARRVAELMTTALQRMLSSVLEKFDIDRAGVGPLPSPADLFAPLLSPVRVMPVVLLSAANITTSAIINQLFFVALGYEVPFGVNVFVVSLFFFVFLLPISFGGFGIREGAYILLYGLFEVPAETALVVSFFALSGQLLNYAIGGLSIYSGKSDFDELMSRGRSRKPPISP